MNKNIFLWSLYDFANSIIMIAFLFYFSQWLIIDSHKPDWWYNLTLILSSAVFIVIGPLLAQRLDVSSRKLHGVRVTSIIMTFFYLATAAVMLFAPTHPLLATIFFTLAMSSYLLSFVYYTPMINDISHDANRAWISGIGHGANYAGQVFGLLITLPFATGALYLFGASGRAQALLPAVIVFVILALPMFLWYRESGEVSPANIVSSTGYRGMLQTVKRLFSIRNLSFLFIGYFFFSDAVLTFSNNFAIFLEKVFGVSDDTKTYLTAGILILSSVGSVILGKIADTKGRKRTLLLILCVWVVLLPFLAFTSSFTMAAVICLIAGIFYGPVWGISRALVSEYTPREVEASSFGIYIIAERFATFIGPVVWSIVLATTASHGTTSYSYAIVSMGVLVLVSMFFISKIKSAPKVIS